MTEQLEYNLRGANENVVREFNDELVNLAAKLGPRAKNLQGFAIVLYGEDLTPDGGNTVMSLVGEPKDLESVRVGMEAPIAQMAKDVEAAKTKVADMFPQEPDKCDRYPNCLCGLIGLK